MSNIYGKNYDNGSRKNLSLSGWARIVASIDSNLIFPTKLTALHILCSPQLPEIDATIIPN